ncbi:MAG: hypothetical protein HYX73_07410 [Acidobacteria bacterium]|nr:hypothetical protein [Acidobacteriota bacterium]
MDKNKKWFSATMVLVLMVVASYAVFQWQRQIRQDTENVCQICWRPVHSSMLTMGEVNGEEKRFCCPACALTTAQQTGRPVHLTRLTDLNINQPLDPKTAILVRGSDVNLDMHSQPLVDQEKRPVPVHFDRCTPSILAFRTREEAQTFQRDHGGELLQITDLKPHLVAP